MKISRPTPKGFTIVELLIVIVVIGILATITIVAYSGIQSRARIAVLQSDLEGAAKQLGVANVLGGSYPLDLNAANLKASSGTTYAYYYGGGGSAYCLAATNAGTTYSVTNISSTPQSGDCLANGTVGWWPLNGNATDQSSSGSNGAVVGATLTTSQNGDSNGAYSFSGAGSYISNINAPGPTTTGSISAWVKVNAWGTSYDSIVFKGPGVGWASIDYTILRNNTANQFVGSISNGTNTLASGGPQSSVISLGLWYHLVFTWDGTNAVFYTNGAVSGTVPWTYAAANRSPNMSFGMAVGNANYPLNGNIDDVRIYNRALSAAEALALFNAGAK